MKHFRILLLMLIGLGATVTAQDISPQLDQQLDGIETFTAQTRGLEPLEPIDRRFPTRAEAVAEIKSLYATEISPEEAERLNQFYHAFGFLTPDADYVSLYLEALEAQIGGFYDPETKEMNTLLLNGGEAGDSLPLLEQIVYAHEFTHALQDQHFDLTAIDEATQTNPDQAQAVLALIEGDATLVMNLYVQKIAEKNPLGTSLQLLAQGFSTDTLFMPPNLPDIIAEELLSSYTDGAVFVSALQAQGGWDAVNRAFEPEHWPLSSEQTLHPDKYLSGEAPVPVQLNRPALDPEWETIWDTTFGEFYLRQYLKLQVPSRDAARAAAGWGGDHYQVYRQTTTGELAWVMQIVWDTPADAREFTDAYVEFLTDHFEGVVAVDSCWSTISEALCFTDRATGHILASAPTLTLAQNLIASQE